MSVFTKVLRAGEGKKVRRLAELVPLVNELESEIEALSDDDLRHKTVEFRERLDAGETLDDLLIEGFAVVREASWRVLGQRHFDVQVMGGMALHFGWIAEMKTGEGKTLVSTMPVYLNALARKGVHVVTVNDYLATRDAEWMGRVYRWLGLTVGRVGPDVTDPKDKREAYNADVTYGTNTEFGFDYLRDNMQISRETMVQRGHVFAIVDEVDSILIDEARTPLIISGPADEAARLYYQFASLVRTLERDVDYEVDEEKRHVVPLESGIAKVERAVGLENLYDAVSVNYVHQLIKALEAKELYHRDKEYLVDQGEVKIIDEFTGRTLEGRRWSDGLHQAVEAKERVRIKEENHTWATVTLQNYFRLYDKLSGMTGTAETEASEFANTYNLPVVPIPTNKPMIRTDEPDLIFKSESAKFNAVVEDIAERYERGQPVLVGTASVVKSEVLSRLLEKRGIPHNVLNAKQHFREAEIVAQAGRPAAVTVATNMAGRGVDIILGGNPELLAAHQAAANELDLESDEGREVYARLLSDTTAMCAGDAGKVVDAGGLYVLGSERHESRRIDNQLRGRSGRQGDPGESRFYLSLEDDLMRLFATGAMSWVMGRTLPEEVPIEAKMVTKAIERAQSTVEGRNSEIRKEVLKYDEVMNEQRKVIYARRMQVIDGEDLEEHTRELIVGTVEGLVQAHCPSDYVEEWDLEQLVKELTQYYPTEFTVDDLTEGTSSAHVTESVVSDALDYYDRHSASLPGGVEQARRVEREVMLHVIDRRWREHLAEMDYLRDVLHVEVVAEPAAEPDLDRAVYAAADDPVGGTVALASRILADQGVEVAALEVAQRRAAATVAAGAGAAAGVGTPAPNGAGAQRSQRPIAGSERQVAAGRLATARGPSGRAQPGPVQAQAQRGPERGPLGEGRGAAPVPQGAKVGRNDPCWCGSGKKYKFCHGAA